MYFFPTNCKTLDFGPRWQENAYLSLIFFLSAPGIAPTAFAWRGGGGGYAPALSKIPASAPATSCVFADVCFSAHSEQTHSEQALNNQFEPVEGNRDFLPGALLGSVPGYL